MGYQPPKIEKEIHILQLLKYLTASMFAVVVFSLLLKATIASTGQFGETLPFENSFYSYSEKNFDIEIGDKTINNNSFVKFSTPAEKETGFWGNIFNSVFGEKQYNIEFALVDAVDEEVLEEKLENLDIEKKSNNKNTVTEKNNKLVIKNAIDDIDVELSPIENYGVKENIIVNASENIVYDTYLYSLNIDEDMIVHKAAPGNSVDLPVGTYYFSDLENNYIAHFLPLIAYDSNGSVTEDIEMSIVPLGEGLQPSQEQVSNLSLQYIIAITLDKDWLTNPDLQYPIIIDPTIVHDTQGEFEAGEENRLQTTTDPRTELKYHELPADVNTVGLWHLDDSSGQTVSDSSGNGNDGTLGPTSGSETQDPSWNTTTQKLGDSALTFDGSDDEVKVTDTTNLKLTDEMTVEAWVQGQGASFVSTQRTSTSVNKYWPQMQVAGDKVYFVWDTNNGSSSVAEIWTASMNTDGTGWSATQRTSNSYIDRTPELQVVGNKIYFVFVQNDASNYSQIWTASMNTDGTGWSATKRTTTTTSKEFPQMQVYGSKIYYTYHENDGTDTEIWTASMNTDGTGWSATRRTSNGNRDWRPRLFVAGDKIYYTWKYYTNPYQIMTAYSKIDGSGWTATQQTSAYINNDNPRLYVVDNKIYYVFIRSDGSYNQLWTATTNLDGTGWNLTQRTTTLYDKEEPEIQIIGNKIYYIWGESDGAVKQIWTATSNIDGTNFITTKHTTTTNNKTYPQFQIIGSKYYFVWQENISGNQIVTGSYGSNIINKGDFYGIGIVGNTVKGFVNGGVDTMKYNASAISYSNGVAAEGTIDSTNWHHVAATFDGSTINTFIDGNLIGSMTQSMSISTNTASATDYPLIIGDAFDGSIDEVRITSRALSPEEIYYDAQLRPYGEYTSDVIDLGVSNPTFNSLTWDEYGVRTGDGETDLTTAGLIAKWNFNETSGTSVADSSGNGNTGTLNNFSNTTSQDAWPGSGWTDDNKRWGAGALMIDGTDDFIQVTNNAALSPTSAITVSSWVKFNDFYSGSCLNNEIVAKGEDSTNGYYALAVQDAIQTCSVPSTGVNNASFTIKFSDSSTEYITGSENIMSGRWYYFTGTYDGSSMKVYVNGHLSGTKAVSKTMAASSQDLFIGKMNNVSFPYWVNGTIDSTSIYSRALSMDEILSNYQMGQIELQTRTGTDTTPDDGSWEAWKPSDLSVTAQIDDMDTEFSFPDEGLEAYWLMDETSGSNVDDYVNNYDGTANGTSIVDGLYSKARDFNGTSDSIQINGLLNEPTNITISAWANLDSSDSNGAEIISLGDHVGLRLDDWNGGANAFYYGGTNYYTTILSNDYAGTGWHHFVYTIDDTNDVQNFYVDGVLMRSDNYTPSINWNGLGSNTIIGRHGNGSTVWDFNGQIDEIAIFDRALDYSEVQNMFHYLTYKKNKFAYSNQTNAESEIKIEGNYSQEIKTGYLQNDPHTIGLWHLDETAGTSAYLKDSSGNGYHGTPTNATVTKGVSQKAQSMSGSNSTIDIAKNASELGLGGNNAKSVEAWVYTRDFNSGGIFGMGSQANTEDFSLRTMDTDNIWRLQFWGAGNDYDFEYDSLNKWVYFAVTYDGSEARVYADGQLVGTVSITLNTTNTNDFQIGRWYGLFDFDGIIDEVRLSNIARSPEEIAESYRMGASHYLTRSLASAKDLSGNNKLSYYIASDSPGTHISSTAGESPYANYQPDANTVGLWHLDGDDRKELSYDLSGTSIRTVDWVEVDPNAKISQNNGIVLASDTTNAWDAGLISRGTYKRESGKTIYAKFITSSSVAAPNYMMIGWGQNQTSSASYANITHALYFYAGNFYVYQDGTQYGDTGYDYAASTTYEIKITLLSSGSARYEVKGGAYTNWTTILAADNPKINDSLRVQISNYRHVGIFTEVSVLNNTIASDSSVNNNEGRVFEATSATGQIGNARYFDGVDDYIGTDFTDGLDNFTIEAWMKADTDVTSYRMIFSKEGPTGTPWNYRLYLTRATGIMQCNIHDGTSVASASSISPLNDNQWHYVVCTKDSSDDISLYVDGVLNEYDTSATFNGNDLNSQPLWIGKSAYNGGSYPYKGLLDEVRISSVVRTQEEIRQVYEIGKRTHDVTIDFAADLDSGNLISGSGDTSFTIDATAYGLSEKGANLFPGDKVIVRENYDGTEYIAQGTVTSVNKSTGAVTVNSWDSGGTFPGSGYTQYADVFKWQREYFDISGAMPSHIDAVDELSFRFLDGNVGRTFWIDDIHMIESDGYLTDETGSTILSTPQRYIQYRALLTTTDPDPTPALGPITLDYTEGDITMTAASTSESYMNTENNSAFNVQCNGVSYAPSGDTVTCYGSWNQTNWFAIDTATSPLSSVTIQDDENVAGWTDYPLGNGTYTLYARAEVNGNYSDTKSFSIEKDVSRPSVLSITSVAGDTSATYYDTTDDSSTTVIYTADTDAVSCKWEETDVTYGAMTNMCGSTTSCTLDLSGEEEKTIYMRCVDTAGNYSDSSYQLDYTIDATPPAVTSITSVAGDTSSPYKDGTDNSSTVVIYSASADAVSCKWDETDLTYGAMADTCASTSSCTLDVTGEGSQTVYMRCLDAAGLGSSSSYQLDYTIDTTPPVINSITSVAGDTVATYYDTTDDSSTQILFDVSLDTTECKWDSSDVAYDSMANTCSSAGDCTADLSGDGAKTVYIRCKDDVDNKMTSSTQVNYTIDTTPPEVTAITSVAGDTSATYYDNTDDGSTAVVYTASADAVSCKWDETDLTYGAMANSCTDTSNCDLDLTGEGAQTVYMRCLDSAGLASSTSYQLDYTIDTTPPSISAVNSVDGDTSAPYYDTTDDSSTIINFTSSADTTDCKWDESDITYSAMANACTDDSNCDVDLTGEGTHTVYIRCIDDVDNPMISSQQVDYTIDATPPVVNSITSVAGDTSAPYYDGTDDGSTAVVMDTSTDAVSCKWNATDVAYASMTNTCTDTSNCSLDLTGEGAHTVYIRCLDEAGLSSTSSYILNYNIDTTAPDVTSITSVAGDFSSPYKDNSDDSSTVVVYTADADATSCKWNENDVAFASMTNTCSSTSSCTLDLTGEGSHTVYMRCEDEVGNPSASSYQLDYEIDSTPPTINSITSVAGDTASIYYDNTDDSSTQILFDVTADATACKWSTTDQSYASMSNACSSVGDCTATLPGQGDKTVYIRCIDDSNNPMLTSTTVNYTIDSIVANVLSVSSVAGDTEAPYVDIFQDGEALIVYTADTDAVTCKWDNANVAYDSMGGTCESTTNCTVDHQSDGYKSVFMRCEDIAGNKSTNSYQVDYEVDENIQGGGIRALLETSNPGDSGNILVTFTLDLTTAAAVTNGSIKIRLNNDYDLSNLTKDDVTAAGGDVTWTNDEVIYDNGTQVVYQPSWWIERTHAAGEDSIVFPFTGTLDNSDGQLSFTIGGVNEPTNPSTTGPQEVIYDVYDNANGTGDPVEEGDGLVYLNHVVVVTATVPSYMTFDILPVASGTVNGETITHPTTLSNAVGFGLYDGAEDRILAHDLRLSTNAREGYIITVEYDQTMASATDTMKNFTGSNATPLSWTTPPGSGTESYFGYTTDDDSLYTAPYARFSGNKWSAFSSLPMEVAHDSEPVFEQITRIGYRLEITKDQSPGAYATTVTYIATPTF